MSEYPVKDQVILASAGSGKTYALSDRIIKLLATQQLLQGKIAPQEIVALTFTRAAAGEFVAKTLAKLAEAAASEENAAAIRGPKRLDLPASCDAAFFRKLLRDTLLSMHRLTLGTLDSFFAKLVSNNPTEVGLDGGEIRAITDVEASEVRQRVISQMMAETDPSEVAALWAELRNLNQGQAVATPLQSFDETVKSLHDLATLAKDGAMWGEAATIWPTMPELFTSPTEEEIEEAEEVLAQALAGQTLEPRTREIFDKHFASLSRAGSAGDYEKGDWDKFGEKHAAAVVAGAGPVQLLYWKKPVSFNAKACSAYRIMARKAYGLYISEKLAQTKAMYRLLGRYEEIYNREVRRKGRLTFSDNVTLLLNAAGKFDIDYRLDCTIKHWLFDEFQDTSTRQYKVLADNLEDVIGFHGEKDPGRTAFFVGDLKQSLYGWRAGNPDLLRDINQKISGSKDDRLDYTRRCAEPVVDLVNAVLGGLTPYGPYFSTEAAERWAKIWGNHTSKNPNQPKLGEALWVKLGNLQTEIPEGTEDSDPDEAETSKIASQARWIGAHLKSSGLIDEKNGLLQPGITCAILVSKNKQAAEITEELRRMGIEAADEAAAEVAMDNPYTAGFVSLIKNTAHPTDRLSKGMANMSPSAKAYVDLQGGWEAARLQIAKVFYEKGGEAVLQEILKDRMPVGATNGERFLAKRVQQVLALAVKFDEEAHRDLGAFAAHLEESALRDTADPRCVQVLTIHRSKGLQYTAVYLPCLNNDKQKIAEVRVKDPMIKTDAEFNPQWVLSRPKANVCGADPEILDPTLTDERTAAAYENLCRLYVGMTRAIRRLVLVTDELKAGGREAILTDENHRKYDFAMLIEAVLGTTAGAALELPGACVATVMAQYGTPDWIKHSIKATVEVPPEVKRDATQLIPVKRTERLRPSKTGEKYDRPWTPGKDEARGKAFGTLVHELFQHLEWDAGSFVAGLEGKAWPVERAEEYDAAVEVMKACLASPTVAELLLSRPAGALLWNERKATLMHEGKAISAVFDRVHVIPGRAAVVIDYKTNDCTVEHLKEMYQGQMDLYRIAVAKLCGLTPEKVRCVLVHVRLGELVEC